MIRIESVELDNFKSFGMKKRITFEDGFTVVSGPNGSGKSNIGDGLLFVLGIRSTKLLRADRLPDFIHKAASRERQKNYCRVTLSIVDDTDPLNGLRYSITRELSQEGVELKSNYFINGTRCRRSDVEDLIERLQIYLDSYSFVLQGDINNIVKMTGTERRKLLESISGIESYDVKLEKARKDIDGIVANIAVIRARAEEKTLQLAQLKVEKETAEKYEALSSEIGDLRLTIIEREIQSETRQSEMYSREIEKIEQQIGELSIQSKAIDEEIANAQKATEDLNGKIRSIQGDRSRQIIQQINDLKVVRSRALDAISDGREKISKLSAKIEDDRIKQGESDSKIESLLKESKAVDERLKALESEISLITSKIEEMNEGELGAISDINQLNLELKDLENSLSSVTVKETEVLSEIAEKEKSRSEILSRKASLVSSRDHISMEIKHAQWMVSQANSSDKSAGKKLAELQKSFESLRAKMTSLKSARSEEDITLKKMIREQEKLSATYSTRGGRALKSISDAVSGGELTGVFGTLKSLIEVDEKYLKALEASGGSRLNSVVVSDDAVAERCLSILKREKTGRLTFLPLNKISVSSPRGKAVMLKNSGEALCFMHEVVGCDPQFRSAVLLVFSDTLLMRDIQSARKNMGGVRMVTLDGDIFEANGAITGGYLESHNSIADEMKLSRLMADISAKEAEIRTLDSEIQEIDERLRQITLELTEASGNSAAGNRETQLYEKIISDNEPKFAKVEEEIAATDRAISEVESVIAARRSEIAGLQGRREELEGRRKTVYSKMERISPELISKKVELESSRTSMLGARDELIESRGELDSLIREKRVESTSLGKTMDFDGQEIKETEERIKKAEEKLESVNIEMESLVKVQSEIDAEVSSLLSELKSSEGLERELAGKKELVNRETGEARESRASLSERMSTIRGKIEELDAQRSQISGKVLATDMSTGELKRRISELTSDIAALGSVNHRAIEQYTTELNEVTLLRERMEELGKEKSSLEELMDQINNQKKLTFLELFDAVNKEINSIYYVLSDGGEAGLEITDRENPMEAEVYIKARPKGSNFSKIEALSGGEKSLTALAFIMSIQRINPSPVYYLDEVDMFLDGANAERVGRMFKENSRKSQIIAVSLRQAMLKYADNIIGVTTFDDENSEVFFKSFADKEKEESDEE